jgi:hypothetical protein
VPRVSKRTIALRTAHAAAATKKRRIAFARQKIPDSCFDGGALSRGDSSSSDIEVMINEEPEDDVLILNQPAHGWKEAERQLQGRSWSNAGKTKQSRWYYSQKAKEEEKEKGQLQQTYGDISRIFGGPQTESIPNEISPDENSPSSDLVEITRCSSDSPSLSPPPLRPPPGWQAPPPGPLTSFVTIFFNSVSFRTEIQQLDIWLKKNKEQVTGDWLKRMNGVRYLLLLQESFLYSSTPAVQREGRWRDYSESISVRLGKGPKYALALRRSERDWFESRITPPHPMRGKHVNRASLFDDEGVILAVREYLNAALWHANPRGLRTAVRHYLQNQSVHDTANV